MIISNNQIKTMLAQYFKKELNPQGEEGLSRDLSKFADEVSLSQDAKGYIAAKEFIREMPEIREDRLADIKKQVKTGTYTVDDEEVAEKMIGRSLVDELV